MFESYDEVREYIRQSGIEMISLKVSDLNGAIRQVSIPASNVSESLFVEGLGLGMSSYPGYRTIDASDMKVIPDVSTGFPEPSPELKMLSFLCNIYYIDGHRFERDPRYIASKAEEYARKALNVKDVLISPELEFYVFDDVRYETAVNRASYEVESVEATWNTARRESPNLGFKIPRFGGQHCSPPKDHLVSLRSSMVRAIESCGIKVKYHHHEAGGPGQCEIELHFNGLAKAADQIQISKYLIRNVAFAHGKTATFMPKPLYDEAGNGMHLHLYASDGTRSVFFDPKGYGGLNDMAIRFTVGLLKHTPALMAITNPSTNSYRRFGPGLAAPMKLFFSVGNRSAAIRIPGYAIEGKEQRIEYRIPDAMCNPYLCLAAVVMAGIDGVKSPASIENEGFGPYDVNVYALSREELAAMKSAPSSFDEALKALVQDGNFLSEGGVFDAGFVETWLDMKKDEAAQVSVRPHPHEYVLYYDR